MSEKPIILNGEMVNAILRGDKTQTRRPLKHQPKPQWTEVKKCVAGWDFYDPNNTWSHGLLNDKSPYQVGDHLYVRETWRVAECDYFSGLVRVQYKADMAKSDWIEVDDEYVFERLLTEFFDDCISAGLKETTDDAIFVCDGDCPARWRPGVSMFKWASRVTLEVTDVRVERVQDISRGDAIAESHRGQEACEDGGTHKIMTPSGEFEEIWDSIYRKRRLGFDVNPWAWVCEFKRVR